MDCFALAFNIAEQDSALIHKIQHQMDASIAEGDSFEVFAEKCDHVKRAHREWLNPRGQTTDPLDGGRDDD